MQADSAATLLQYAHNTEAKHGKHRNDSGSDSDSNDSGSGEDDTDEGAFEHSAVDGKTEVVVRLSIVWLDLDHLIVSGDGFVPLTSLTCLHCELKIRFHRPLPTTGRHLLFVFFPLFVKCLQQ